MHDALVIVVTVVALVCARLAWHYWIRRAHRGQHAFYDARLSAGATAARVAASIREDQAAYRALQAKLTHHRAGRGTP